MHFTSICPMKFVPMLVLAALLAGASMFAGRSPVEAHGFCLFCVPPKHHAARTEVTKPDESPDRPFDPTFCLGIIKAFGTLHAKDLDTFIFSIPADKREEARRCMTDRK